MSEHEEPSRSKPDSSDHSPPQASKERPEFQEASVINEETILAAISELDKLRIEKEKSMDYMSAENLRKEIDKLKKKLERCTKSNLKSRHDEEAVRVHSDRIAQIEGFNHEWQIKIEEFLMSSEEILEKTKQKHSVELEQYLQDLQKKINPEKKKSAAQ